MGSPKRSSPSILRSLAGALRREKRVRFAYAYGSFLRRQDARDINVAVYLEGKADPWLASGEIAGALEKAIARRYRVDVHSLNAAAAGFAFQVLKDGRPLMERRPSERMDWEAHALSRYQDIRPMLEFHDRRFLSR